jgi:ABC-type lipoprotein export system ATPase subunit
MVSLIRRIRIADEETIEIDLRQEKQVEEILRKLSRHGTIAIENAASVSLQISEMATNEVR